MADEEKDRIADALRALSGDASAPFDRRDDDHAPRKPVVRPLEPEAPRARPPVPLRPTPAAARPDSTVESLAPKPVLDSTEPSGLDHIIEDENDLAAFPAPSEEMLHSAARQSMLSPARRGAATRSLTAQRTLIPILLTLALLLPGFGTWLFLRPAESELRLYGQRLIIYMIVGGVVFLGLAIVNMIQVRNALRRAVAAAPASR